MSNSKYYDGTKFVELGKDEVPVLNADNVILKDIEERFVATDVENALNELFTNVSNGKDLVATAITDKGVATSGSDTFNTMATNIESIQVGTPDLHGVLTVGGTYGQNASYSTPSGCSMGSNYETGEVFIIMQTGTSTAYENRLFSLASAPSGITLASTPIYTHASNSSQIHYGCVLRGVTAKINVSADVETPNSIYDNMTAVLTVTYA